MSDARPGQRLHISATAWNRHEAVARAYDRGDLQPRNDTSTDRFDPSIVWIQNKTGADRDQFDIVKLGDPSILPSADEVEFRQRVLFRGEATTAGCQFAVLLAPAAVDAVVKAKIAGIVQSKVTKTTTAPTYPFSLTVEAGQYKLKQSSGGVAAQARWAEPGTGVKWAYIQLGLATSKPPLVALLNGDLHAQLSASATLYEGSPGALTLSSETITVWDGIMDPGDLIVSGSRIWVAPSYEGEQFCLVPYCKATTTPPTPSPPVITPPPDENYPLSRRFANNYSMFVAQSYSSMDPGSGLTNDNEGI